MIATSKYELQIANLSGRIQELRQIRHSASHPFFDKSHPLSRVRRICEERERLAQSIRGDWRVCSNNGMLEQPESNENFRNQPNEGDLSNSYTDIAYMLQSDDYDRLTNADLRTNGTTANAIGDTRLSRQVRQQSNARLQATVKLLAESIEEAANLRAILEYSMDPDKLDILLGSSLLNDENTQNSHSIGSRHTRRQTRSTRSTPSRSSNNNKWVSDDHDQTVAAEQHARDFKHRALLLEQSNLVDQVLSLF